MILRDRQALLDTVALYFAKRDDIRLVLVFGSVASGRFTDSSDVDIAIAGDGALSYDQKANLRVELSELLGRSIDLVDLITAEGLILHEALVHGVRVKLDRNLYVRLHTRMLVDREDFWPLKREMQAARIRRFFDGS